MQCIAQDIQQNDKQANLIYINKEDFRYDSIKDAASLVHYVESKLKAKANNYLFVDEIQDIEQFEKALRSFQANNQCDIFCSGSNAKILSGELATYLAGRYIAFTIHSLNYNEFLHFHQLKDEDESFMQYLQLEHAPLASFRIKQRPMQRYLRNIYSTIFLKDIVSRENIRNVVFLEKLLQFTADNIAVYIGMEHQ
jgi:predicted AAA+ superfamily ATPase